MDATDIAAWWGAGIASLVFIWDIFKWVKRGVRISFRVQTNMQVFGGLPKDDNTYISARVVNRGTLATTIENMGFEFYKSRLHYYVRKRERAFVINQASTNFPIPHNLNPGGIWDGMAIQTGDVEQMSIDGYLNCCIYFSHREKAYTQRVRPISMGSKEKKLEGKVSDGE